jgi:pimeloyl-ACP methyl ester carboxylesterase
MTSTDNSPSVAGGNPAAARAGAHALASAVVAVSATVEQMQAVGRDRVGAGFDAAAHVHPTAETVGRAASGVLSAVAWHTTIVHTQIRGITRLSDAAIGHGASVVQRRRQGAATEATPEHPRWAATTAALSAAFGDSLAADAASAPLVSPMALRFEGAALDCTPAALARAYPDATGTVVVFVHGLAATELVWSDDYAAAMASSGATSVFVRYNTGDAIADNGRALSHLLDELVCAWPQPVTRLIVVGHSMGGLVTRAACAAAAADAASWPSTLTDVVTLATPHRGAPMEKVANVVIQGLRLDPMAAPVADLCDSRSRGIKDLRFGAVRDEDWAGEHPDAALLDRTTPLPLPAGTRHHAAVATLSENPDSVAAAVLGDGLVRPPSAAFAPNGDHDTFVLIGGAGHNDLLDHPRVTSLLTDVVGGAQ